MALQSNILIDLAAGTIILNAQVGSDIVDIVTYDNATKRITFSDRAEVLTSFSEFVSFCEQMNIFQTAILFNYSPNVAATTPFLQILADEHHTPGQWNMTVSSDTDPNVAQYEGTHSSSKLLMIARVGDKTIDFPEWLFFLQVLNHYKLSIKNF
jgi:hypothetical protein